MNRSATAALLLAAWAALAGCPGSEGADCELDEECLEGLICFAGTCQELGTPAGEVVFEVIPRSETGLGSATYPMAGQPLHFDSCGPSRIAGSVAGEAQVAIRGSPAGLSGEIRSWRERVVGDFGLQVPPGDWSLTFLLEPSQNGLAPPPVRREVKLGRCQSEQLGPVEPEPVQRTATFEVVVDPARDPRPRCGLVAQLVDPATQLPLSQTLALEPEPGRSCANPPGGWRLVFTPPASGGEIDLVLSPLGLLPTAATRTFRLSLPAGDPAPLGTVGIGAETVERVELAVTGPDGLPVEGAEVRATRIEEENGVVFEPPAAEPVKGKPGAYELWLLPGRYELEALPPRGMRAGAARCARPAGSGLPCVAPLVVTPGRQEAFDVTLGPPALLSGRVTSSERYPVTGARIRALPRGAGRAAETVSGADGRYELPLVPGNYELVAMPREADRAWRRLVLEEPFLGDEIRNLTLPRTARVVGQVTATRNRIQSRVHGALVRAWRVDLPDGPVVVGEALTDAEGRFALALPAEP